MPQYVTVLGGDTTVVDSVAPAGLPASPAGPEAGDPGSRGAPGGPSTLAPIGSVIGARSGDKGGDANLGLFARSEVGWAWLDQDLTVDRLRSLLPETAELVIERHRLPNVWALNFVIRGLLEEGVAASTRQDAQAKAVGEWIRSRVLPIPDEVLAASIPNESVIR